MRVLITGGTGLLGKALIETNIDLHEIRAVYFGNYDAPDNKAAYFNVDICNRSKLESVFLEAEPHIVIHTAGIANVDFCEKNYKQAWHSNVYGTEVIIDSCKKHDAKLVFISTNAIFDGGNAPYSEEDLPTPINSYGKMKLECEKIVQNSELEYLIIRPILMYGWNNKHERSNTVTWLIQKLSSGEKVNIVNDVYENPLYNLSCAEAIWKLISLNKKGIYHVAGKDVVNRYEFALAIAEVFSLDKNLISPVPSDFFSDIAPRPRNTSYNTTKIEKELKIKPLRFKEGLLLMKKSAKEKLSLCQK